jgi:nucleotide-binding universal stress UspA family protein
MTTSAKVPGIVVGIDGSAPANAAVAWAAREAALHNLPLTVVHVVSSLAGTWPQTPLPLGLGRWQKQQGQLFLEEAVSIVEKTAGTSSLFVKTEIYYSGVVPTLIDMSKESEMLVVGANGQGVLAALLGSVASGVIRHAHCPVAVIHNESSSPPTLDAPVLVGIDGSPVSDFATTLAFDEASRRRVGVIAVHAWNDGKLAFPGIDWPPTKAVADEVLAERLAGFQERYPDVTIGRVVVQDHPARQLIDRAQTAQLVVVGSHGRGGFAGMVLGSVSAAVVQSVHAPVIVARKA